MRFLQKRVQHGGSAMERTTLFGARKLQDGRRQGGCWRQRGAKIIELRMMFTVGSKLLGLL